MCKKIPGGGWNRRKGASNNFVKAIREGEITESMLANIMGVTVDILTRMIKGSLHHFQPNKKVKEVRTYKRCVINSENIVAVKAKRFELSVCASNSEKKEYKRCLWRNSEKLNGIKETIIKKWDKASEKLKAKYAPELSNEDLL